MVLITAKRLLESVVFVKCHFSLSFKSYPAI